MTNQPATALTIAGSDSGGGAGAQADLKTFLACGVHGMSAITAVTVQNSLGVSGVYDLPPAAVVEQIEAVLDDIGIGATKTGMLASARTMTAVAEVVRRRKIAPFVVDPVAASQHGEALFPPEALATLRDVVIPLATIVTPNLNEVRLLTGLDVRDRGGMRHAAKMMRSMGPRWVLIKGGHLADDAAVDVLYDGGEFVELVADRIDTPHVHGSGDTLAAAITAGLARGMDVLPAVQAAKRLVTGAVANSYPIGAGTGPVGHFWRLRDWPAT